MILLAALAAVACGSDSDERLPATALVSSADRTVDQGTAKMAFSLTLTGVAGTTEPLVLTGEAEADLEERRNRVTMDIPEAFVMGGTGPGATQHVEMILDGSIVYYNFPFLTESTDSETPWVKVDLESLSPQLAGLQSVSSGQNDPSQTLNYLRGATGDLEVVGTEEVRGVRTTHYRGTVDLARAAERAPEEVREQVEASLEQLASQTDATTLPMNVWLGEDGLVRRVQYEYPLPQQTAGGSGEGSMVFDVELYDFGAPVDVSPPPPDQVTDIADLMPAGG